MSTEIKITEEQVKEFMELQTAAGKECDMKLAKKLLYKKLYRAYRRNTKKAEQTPEVKEIEPEVAISEEIVTSENIYTIDDGTSVTVVHS